MDAHLRLFEEIGGVPNEIVYDNMRNVVSKFIGRNEKQLNEELVKLSVYYGFNINVTNCFSGNEKSHVEGSVRYIRNKVFTTHYEFETIEDAELHLEKRIVELNQKCRIKEEKLFLKKLKPRLDLAKVSISQVDKYSTVRVENNFYSVPEVLVGKQVTIKNYLKDLEVYYNHKKVCEHKKKDGHLEYIIDIMHYLRTFTSKPGALNNSTALINNPSLKTIFDEYYITQPKLFIQLLLENKEKTKEAEINEYTLTEFLDMVLIQEREIRFTDSVQNKLRQAKFPNKLYLEDYQLNNYDSVQKKSIKEVITLDFLEQKENILLFGNPGVGKSHLAIGLGIKACLENKTVLFISDPI